MLWPPDKLCTIRNHSTCFLYKQGRKKNDENVCYVVGIGRDSMNQFKHFPFSRRSHQHNQPTIIHSFMETQNGTHSGQHNTHNNRYNPVPLTCCDLLDSCPAPEGWTRTVASIFTFLQSMVMFTRNTQDLSAQDLTMVPQEILFRR